MHLTEITSRHRLQPKWWIMRIWWCCDEKLEGQVGSRQAHCSRTFALCCSNTLPNVRIRRVTHARAEGKAKSHTAKAIHERNKEQNGWKREPLPTRRACLGMRSAAATVRCSVRVVCVRRKTQFRGSVVVAAPPTRNCCCWRRSLGYSPPKAGAKNIERSRV